MGGATAGTMLALHGMRIEVLASESGSVGVQKCLASKKWVKVITEEGYTSQAHATINANLARQEFLASLPGNVHDPAFDGHFDNITETEIDTPCDPVQDPTPVQGLSVEYEEYFTLDVPGGLAWRFTLTITLDVTYCNPRIV